MDPKYIPGPIVLFNISKQTNEDPIDPNWIPFTLWSLPTQYLYYPEIPPDLNPPLPRSFDFDIAVIKQMIRRP